MPQPVIHVLFVCMGNICRSPSAEGVFRQQVDAAGLSEYFFIDSAGTIAAHVGEAPDGRAMQSAELRGIDLSGLSARKFQALDLERFDYILAMDQANYADIMQIATPEQAKKVYLMLDFHQAAAGKEVPDPYYGGRNGFEHVLDLLEGACQGLLTHIRTRHLE